MPFDKSFERMQLAPDISDTGAPAEARGPAQRPAAEPNRFDRGLAVSNTPDYREFPTRLDDSLANVVTLVTGTCATEVSPSVAITEDGRLVAFPSDAWGSVSGLGVASNYGFLDIDTGDRMPVHWPASPASQPVSAETAPGTSSELSS